LRWVKLCTSVILNIYIRQLTIKNRVWHLPPGQQGIFMKIKLARLSAAIIGACLLSVAFQVQAADKEPISPIKPHNVTNPAVVELGK
jgi:hypothetical protein